MSGAKKTPRKTRKPKPARHEAPVAVMPTIADFASPKGWVVTQHAEMIYLGDPVRGAYTTLLELWAGPDHSGRGYGGSFTLTLFDSGRRETAKYGPEHVYGVDDLPTLRRRGIEWVHGIIASVARDIGLWLEQDNERGAPTP